MTDLELVAVLKVWRAYHTYPSTNSGDFVVISAPTFDRLVEEVEKRVAEDNDV
jgi:hypothetical protein